MAYKRPIKHLTDAGLDIPLQQPMNIDAQDDAPDAAPATPAAAPAAPAGIRVGLITPGSIADADATFAVTVDEGDASDLSGSNSVAAADLLGTTTGASLMT